jgi:membrane-bound lytic murein transglycosylase D
MTVALLALCALLVQGAYGSDLQRPQRGAEAALPPWQHHAGPERYTLALPFGEAQFERYRELYASPGGKAWIQAVYARSRPYALFVMERIRYYGLPEELFFLPFIESEYLPKAVSKSGATGLWQFMRNSIGGYDMRIDEWVDERRDFMKSTDGALRKLQWNYDRFGDWLLAIAAYNCGAGAMDRAIAASGGQRDFWALREKKLLPPETQSYVPKFLAVAWTAMHAGRNGISLGWDEPPQWVTVPVSRPVDMGMLAEAADMSADELRLGNAELLFGITPPDRKHLIKVPVERAEAVSAALASKDRLMNVYIHKVQSGDTVSALARHYSVTVALIAKLNPGLNPDKIRLGQTIAIPAFKTVGPYQADRPAHDELRYGGVYIVKKGDTLWALSLVYGVQPESLAEKNGLSLTSVLREGTALNVPILE